MLGSLYTSPECFPTHCNLENILSGEVVRYIYLPSERESYIDTNMYIFYIHHPKCNSFPIKSDFRPVLKILVQCFKHAVTTSFVKHNILSILVKVGYHHHDHHLRDHSSRDCTACITYVIALLFNWELPSSPTGL